jgi:hypothetical protein
VRHLNNFARPLLVQQNDLSASVNLTQNNQNKIVTASPQPHLPKTENYTLIDSNGQIVARIPSHHDFKGSSGNQKIILISANGTQQISPLNISQSA